MHPENHTLSLCLRMVSLAGFTAYLLSDECDAFDKDDDCVCEDMTQPLSHYFIASSHNTYVSFSQNFAAFSCLKELYDDLY